MKTATNDKAIFNHITLLSLWILIGAVSRVAPHLPNMTAMTSLSLLVGTQFSRKSAVLIVALALLISDLLLAYGFGYAVFGPWSLFTYSGFIVISLLGKYLAPLKRVYLLGFVICASLAFWVWTNFGVWLLDGMYPKSFSGLIMCYTAALPFLRNAVMGDVLWMLVLLNILYYAKRISSGGINKKNTVIAKS